MKWWPTDCKAGDMIRVKLGSVYHYGIFVSEEEVIQFGEAPVGDLLDRDQVALRVCAVSIEAFACGSIVEVAIPEGKEKRTRFSAEKTVTLARSRLGEGGYDLLHNNCEHFAYECAYGVHQCTQADDARRKWAAFCAKNKISPTVNKN